VVWDSLILVQSVFYSYNSYLWVDGLEPSPIVRRPKQTVACYVRNLCVIPHCVYNWQQPCWLWKARASSAWVSQSAYPQTAGFYMP